MAKFHVNAAGNPGECKASAGKCPFASESDHYDSPEAARSAFEAAASKAFTLTGRKSNERVDGSPKTFGKGEHYTIHDLRLGDRILDSSTNEFRVVRSIDTVNTVNYKGKLQGRVRGTFLGPRGGVKPGSWAALMPMDDLPDS